MRINSQSLNGKCTCGRVHTMDTQTVVIESGCMSAFEALMEECSLSGKRIALYDKNTYHAEHLIRPRAEQEIILDPDNLHANEIAVESVLSQMDGDAAILIAVGSGTIHDIARYCANEKKLEFVSCPTAASVDGYVSTVSAMTWNHCKKTMPGVAPKIVIADTSVICRAPARLALSGIGDIIGKYTALADWKIASVLTGEHFCRKIYDLTMEAVQKVYDCCGKIAEGSEEATGQLTEALLLSGLAMQLMGNSRPASGAEHHISHLIEMEPDGIGVHSDALHGEKVGVGTIMISRYYHELARNEDISDRVRPYQFYDPDDLRRFYGERLYGGILAENDEDALAELTPQKLVAAWPEIREIIGEIPAAEELETLYTRTGLKRTLADIEVPGEKHDAILYYSPSVRKRATFNRISRMLRTE